MIKKTLLLVLVLALTAQVAFAAGPQANNPRPGVGNIMRLYFGELRSGLPPTPQAAQARQRLRQAKENLEDLEALAQADPAALATRLLQRHDAMVARAQAIITNQATLATRIVNDLKAAQARALANARTQAANAKNQEAAERRITALQNRQARILAQVERNATQIAAKMIERAQAILAEAPAIRARIVAGEGLDVIRERLQRRLEALRQKRP